MLLPTLYICLGHDIEQPHIVQKITKKHNKLNGSVQRWRQMTKEKQKKKKKGKIDAYCLRCAIRFVLKKKKNVQIVVQSVSVLRGNSVGIVIYR